MGGEEGGLEARLTGNVEPTRRFESLGETL